MTKMNTLTSLTRILMLVCCLGLSACATITNLSIPADPSQEFIDGLLDNHAFDTALMAIDKWQIIHPNDMALPKQRTRVTEAIARFESSSLKKAKQLDAQEKWHETKHIYEDALAKLPSSQLLQNAYSEFSIRRLEHINALKEDLDVARANHWLSISDNVEAVYQVAPNDHEARNWKKNSDSEREQLARRLVDSGLRHEENKRFGTAALRYDLAYRVAPSEYTKPYYERAVKTFAQRKATKTKQARRNQKRQQSRLSQLLTEFDNHLRTGRFRLAKQTLGAMEAINAKSPKVLECKEKLEKKRSAELKKAIFEGKKRYTEGDFDGAIIAWQRALKLEPDNKEVKENIQRAEKFRENLERLKAGAND